MTKNPVVPASPRDLFTKVTFRGSPASRVAFDPATKKLTIGADLLNYNQATYDPERDPETAPGELAFEGVTPIELDPKEALDPFPEGSDGEILELHADEERDGRPVVLLVLQRTDYTTHENTTLVARFHATSASFRPD